MPSNPSKPTPQTDARLATGLLVIFVVMTAMASRYPPVTRSFPMLVGIGGILLSAAESIRLWRRVRSSPPIVGESPRARLVMFGWVATALALMTVLGLVAGGALFVGGFLKVRERESWLFSLLGASGVVLVLYVLLERFFGLPLYAGLF